MKEKPTTKNGANGSTTTESRFTFTQLKVIEALGDPDDGRMQQDIAFDLKIAQETISRWKRLPGFMDAVNDILDSKRKHPRPAIWKAMSNHAKGKSVQDRRLFLEAVGDIRQKADLTGDITVKIDWGPEKPSSEKLGKSSKD